MPHKQITFLLAISIAISTPLSAQEIDTDGDGILDEAETNTGTYIDANDTGTDPLNPDTDEDGFNDGLEALLSTSDPTKPASKPLRTGLLDILAYWDFNEASEPTQTNDLIKGFEGTLMGTTSYTADGGGRSGAAGDKAIDMGSIEKNGTGITVEAGGIFNIAARQDQFAISFWQNLSAVTASSSFRALSPSTTGNQRGIGVHATWVNSNVYFDTAGCCDPVSQRINGDGSSITTLGQWRHIVFQKNGTLKEVWVDGLLILSGNNTNVLPSDFSQLLIGTDNEGGNISGQIDDFAVFADSLSSDEIAKLAAGNDPRSLVPANDDSDFDGIPDAYETANGLNPAVNDANEDLDNDGMSNINEFIAGTNPDNDDSDNDGLKDGVESGTGIFVDLNDTGTNPLNNDSDNDSLLDGIENPNLPFRDSNQPGTDPNSSDSDNDGYSDSSELLFNTDPTSAQSIPETQELLVYYDFNGQAADQMGNAPDASLLVDATITTEAQGASGSVGDEALDLAFPGDGSMAMVDIGQHLEKINITNAVAVSFWQFNTGATQSSAFWLVSPNATNNTRGFQAHTPWSDGTIYVDVAGCCDPGRLTVGGVVIENQWQHFVFQRTISGNLEIWIDGLKVAEKPNVPDLLPLDGSFTIGGEPNSTNSLSGRIDDLAVYSDALKEEQITALAGGVTPIELFGGGSTKLTITAISYDVDSDQASLTWNSRSKANYSIDISETLGFDEWEEVIDDIPSQGDTTTVQLPALAQRNKIFFRVREVQ